MQQVSCFKRILRSWRGGVNVVYSYETGNSWNNGEMKHLPLLSGTQTTVFLPLIFYCVHYKDLWTTWQKVTVFKNQKLGVSWNNNIKETVLLIWSQLMQRKTTATVVEVGTGIFLCIFSNTPLSWNGQHLWNNLRVFSWRTTQKYCWCAPLCRECLKKPMILQPILHRKPVWGDILLHFFIFILHYYEAVP